MDLNASVRLCAERNGLFKPSEVWAAYMPASADANNPLDVAEWLLDGDSGAIRCLKADGWLGTVPSREVLETVLRCMCGQEQRGDRE